MRPTLLQPYMSGLGGEFSNIVVPFFSNHSYTFGLYEWKRYPA